MLLCRCLIRVGVFAFLLRLRVVRVARNVNRASGRRAAVVI